MLLNKWGHSFCFSGEKCYCIKKVFFRNTCFSIKGSKFPADFLCIALPKNISNELQYVDWKCEKKHVLFLSTHHPTTSSEVLFMSVKILEHQKIN